MVYWIACDTEYQVVRNVYAKTAWIKRYLVF